MFYSHEILTSREGGVATVWLVATLGSGSTLKKVNRKAILEVNIQRTCEIIIAPEAPMALRLQSNLLYGVSRVFSQQCGYILSDAQTAQSNMRQLLKSIRTSGLDPEAGKARPDQLVIHDDPAFLPELILPGLDLDLSVLDLSTDDSSRRSSLLSPHSQRSSLTSTHESDESMPGLIIPSTVSGGGGSIRGFDIPGDDRSSAQRASRIRSILGEEEEGFDLDPGFTFDEQGEIVFHDARAPDEPSSAVRPTPVRLGSDSAARTRVRQEIEEGMRAGQLDLGDQMNLELDFDLPGFDENRGLLPEAEAFPSLPAQDPAQPGLPRSSSEAQRESSQSSESAGAPARRRRAPKPLPADAQTSLRNNDLASWKDNYLDNMANMAENKRHHKKPALARKNAHAFVYGTGIGGAGLPLGGSQLPNPLSMFAGDHLMTALTGVQPLERKRSRIGGDEETDSEERRVRARDDDGDQAGRGVNLALQDDDTMGMDLGMQGDEDIEIGRHAVPALEDYSSQMPWNTTASAHGSHQGSIARGQLAPSSIGGSIGVGFASSVGQPGSALFQPPGALLPSSQERRGSHLTSASPLVGRGRQRFSSIDLPIHEAEAGDDLTLGALDEFSAYGPAAGVSTQQAANSQWIRATLDAESSNFLDFVQAAIEKKPALVAAEDEDELSGDAKGQGGREMFFEELLPPQKNTKLVAAQGLHHVLALATKGLLIVRQEADYGPIAMSLREGV